MSKNQLAEALRRIAIESWERQKQPVLLSNLPKMLAEALGADYKTILGDESLKQFIKNSDTSLGYQLIQHPTQRAKLGILPWGMRYEFPPEAAVEPVTDGMSSEDIKGFSRILRTLTPDELMHTSLPASLVLRLLGDE